MRVYQRFQTADRRASTLASGQGTTNEHKLTRIEYSEFVFIRVYSWFNVKSMGSVIPARWRVHRKGLNYGLPPLNPEAPVLKVRISSGLEARHIVSRWREPPEYGKQSDSGLKGRHQRPCAGPSGLRFLILAYRWLTPPAWDISALRG